jgi:hypothetical protein
MPILRITIFGDPNIRLSRPRNPRQPIRPYPSTAGSGIGITGRTRLEISLAITNPCRYSSSPSLYISTNLLRIGVWNGPWSCIRLRSMFSSLFDFIHSWRGIEKFVWMFYSRERFPPSATVSRTPLGSFLTVADRCLKGRNINRVLNV